MKIDWYIYLIFGILLAIPALYTTTINDSVYGAILASTYCSGICLVIAYIKIAKKEILK